MSTTVSTNRDNTPALVAENLTWRVPAGRRGHTTTIVDDISCVIPRGAITMIIGLNGSGKTSLLHLLGGLQKPSAGQILLDGTSIAGLKPAEKATCFALVEQVSHAYVELTVEQVVALGRIPHQRRRHRRRATDTARELSNSSRSDEQIIAAALTQMDIGHLRGALWPQLSGGEKQRVHLARALAQEPQILLLDEPTNHLDLPHQLDLLAKVKELSTTTIAVIHDLDLAAAYADHLIVLRDGRLVAQGATEEVLTEELVAREFGVRARVEHTDRLRCSWIARTDTRSRQ